MMPNEFHFSSDGGLATLGPDLVRVRGRLDTLFLDWAGERGADTMLFPPLMRAEDLRRLDAAAAGIHPDGEHPIPSGFVLPSAACYNVYLFLRGRALEKPVCVTTIANCFRDDEQYHGLRRLRAFTMREIVRVGPADAVRDHLRHFRSRLDAFLRGLDLPFELKGTGDKQEFVYGGSDAFASAGFHRDVFGESCGIRLAGGGPASSGCVAFDIERWLHALLDRFGSPRAALDALSARPAGEP